MNCGVCQAMLPDYGTGVLSTDDRLEVQSHLTGCAVCREHLAADEALEVVLATTSLRQPSAGFTAAVLARVQPHRQPRPAAAWLVPAAVVLSTLACATGLRRLLEVLAWDLAAAAWLRQAAATLAAIQENLRAGWGRLPAWPSLLAGETPDLLWLVAVVVTVTGTAMWSAWRALQRA